MTCAFRKLRKETEKTEQTEKIEATKENCVVNEIAL
jgi:hypothetical protein